MIIKEILNYFNVRFYKEPIRFIVNLVTSVLFITPLLALFQFQDNKWLNLLLFTASILITTLILMIITRRIFNYRAFRSGKIGVLICFDREDGNIRRLKSDFISAIESRLAHTKTREMFDIIIVPCKHYDIFLDNTEAERELKARKGHIFLFGEDKIRTTEGEEIHYLRFHATVRHAASSSENRALIQDELNVAFSKQYKFPVNNDLHHFDYASHATEICILHTLGITSFCSGNIVVAINLLTESHKELTKINFTSDDLEHISKSTIKHLIEASTIACGHFIEKYYDSFDTKHLIEAETFCTYYVNIDRSNFDLNIRRSIIEFFLHNNIDRAFEALNNCSKKAHQIWWLNNAFLLSYNGKLNEANISYRRAFKNFHVDRKTIDQISKTINHVIKYHANTEHLYFSLGIVYYNDKDYLRAINYFEQFLKHVNLSRYDSEIKLARQLHDKSTKCLHLK
jgi:hypothetical protein